MAIEPHSPTEKPNNSLEMQLPGGREYSCELQVKNEPVLVTLKIQKDSNRSEGWQQSNSFEYYKLSCSRMHIQ